MSRLTIAVDQIRFARGYMLERLGDLKPDDWLQQPAAGVSQIAWQVGHLAMAEYRLCLERIRGTRPEDEGLISQEFLTRFGRNSVPNGDRASFLHPDELLAVLSRVHDQAQRELAELADSALDEPVLTGHKFVRTKFDSLLWCGQHEMLHAGQIGIIRRQLGYPPIW